MNVVVVVDVVLVLLVLVVLVVVVLVLACDESVNSIFFPGSTNLGTVNCDISPEMRPLISTDLLFGRPPARKERRRRPNHLSNEVEVVLIYVQYSNPQKINKIC